MKKTLAFLLCLIMILSSFVGCSKEEDIGKDINIYISEPIYNFDPAEAYKNETALKITSLLYDNLFVLDEKGNVKKSLVKNYKYDKKTNKMTIELKDDAFWSDGKQLIANDVMYTWQRILDPSNSFEAAVLLYDIKNAKAVKNGEIKNGDAITLDDIGISALNTFKLEITFENKDVDIDSFLLKLTSAALSPVRADAVGKAEKSNDWAKSTSTMVSSGPFRLNIFNYKEAVATETAQTEKSTDSDETDKKDGESKNEIKIITEQYIVLERNLYYYRDFSKDIINKSVTPNRIIINLINPKNAISVLDKYNSNELYFLGSIPLAERSKHSMKEWEDIATVTDAMSTNTLVLNQNRTINGVKLFANANVRKALSLAIDRQAIANAIVFAKPATGIVPNGVFETDSKKTTFREKADTTLSTDLTEAKSLLNSAKIDASKFSFAISVPEYDEVHVKIAEMIAASWNKLGFKVTVNKISVIDNEDKSLISGSVISGVKDDVFVENLTAGEFDVALFDYVAFSADAFSTLAPFAFGYAGTATNQVTSPEFEVKPHISGYNSEAFNNKIAAAAKETNAKDRAKILHEAEELLMKDLPVIPVVFNQNVVMVNDKLVDVTFDYYQSPNFTKADIKEK